MFEKYRPCKNGLGSIQLPDQKSKAIVDKNGQVFIEGIKVVPETNGAGEHLMENVFGWNMDKVHVSLVVLVAFRKLEVESDLLNLVEPFHIDGNLKNLSPENLGYRFKELIPCSINTGFYRIPFFSRYSINVEGTVINRATGKLPKVAVYNIDSGNRTGGYRSYSIYSDGGMITIGRHRLLCLTFKCYPDNVDKLHVNHDNGVPGDDFLDNLFWVTPTLNNVHAYVNDLRTQNIPVYARNAFTGEEGWHYSCQEASRVTGVDVHVITSRVTEASQAICNGGWLFKSAQDIEWRKVSDPQGEINSTSSPTKVISKNVFSGETAVHESISTVAKDLGLKYKQGPKNQILSKRDRPYYGYLFRTEGDNTPWPEFSERELMVFKDNPSNRARGVVAFKDNGEEEFFTNINKVPERFKDVFKHKGDVIDAIRRKRVVEGFKFRYL